MNSPKLQIHTPQGSSASVFTSAGDYIFRYGDNAPPHSALSLVMPARADEYRRRELHPIFQMNLPDAVHLLAVSSFLQTKSAN